MKPERPRLVSYAKQSTLPKFIDTEPSASNSPDINLLIDQARSPQGAQAEAANNTPLSVSKKTQSPAPPTAPHGTPNVLHGTPVAPHGTPNVSRRALFGGLRASALRAEEGSGASSLRTSSAAPSEPISLLGCSLASLERASGRAIPEVLAEACGWVRARALGEEGLFGASGAADTDKITAVLHAMEERSFKGWEDFDVSRHEVCALIKMFLRGLQDPVLTYERYTDWLALAAGDASRSSSGLPIERIRRHVHQLPRVHRDVLQFLLLFLRDVLAHSDRNLLSVATLAGVFGPLLLHAPATAAVSEAERTAQVRVCELLLLSCSEVFGGPSLGGSVEAGENISASSETSTVTESTPRSARRHNATRSSKRGGGGGARGRAGTAVQAHSHPHGQEGSLDEFKALAKLASNAVVKSPDDSEEDRPESSSEEFRLVSRNVVPAGRMTIRLKAQGEGSSSGRSKRNTKQENAAAATKTAGEAGLRESGRSDDDEDEDDDDDNSDEQAESNRMRSSKKGTTLATADAVTVADVTSGKAAEASTNASITNASMTDVSIGSVDTTVLKQHIAQLKEMTLTTPTAPPVEQQQKQKNSTVSSTAAAAAAPAAAVVDDEETAERKAKLEEIRRILMADPRIQSRPESSSKYEPVAGGGAAVGLLGSNVRRKKARRRTKTRGGTGMDSSGSVHSPVPPKASIEAGLVASKGPSEVSIAVAGGPVAPSDSVPASGDKKQRRPPKPCGKCAQPVRGMKVNALGRVWHPEHFLCATCSCQLTSFFECNGQAFCQEHIGEAEERAFKLVDAQGRPLCGRCREVVLKGTIVTALGKKWHAACFVCTSCGSSLETYFGSSGLPYCELHIGGQNQNGGNGVVGGEGAGAHVSTSFRHHGDDPDVEVEQEAPSSGSIRELPREHSKQELLKDAVQAAAAASAANVGTDSPLKRKKKRKARRAYSNPSAVVVPAPGGQGSKGADDDAAAATHAEQPVASERERMICGGCSRQLPLDVEGTSCAVCGKAGCGECLRQFGGRGLCAACVMTAKANSKPGSSSTLVVAPQPVTMAATTGPSSVSLSSVTTTASSVATSGSLPVGKVGGLSASGIVSPIAVAGGMMMQQQQQPPQYSNHTGVGGGIIAPRDRWSFSSESSARPPLAESSDSALDVTPRSSGMSVKFPRKQDWVHLYEKSRRRIGKRFAVLQSQQLAFFKDDTAARKGKEALLVLDLKQLKRVSKMGVHQERPYCIAFAVDYDTYCMWVDQLEYANWCDALLDSNPGAKLE